MSDPTVTMNVERVAVSNTTGSRAAVHPPAASRSLSQAAPTGKPQQLRQSSVRLVQSEELGRPVVHVLDRETGEVIYQIPPEELQKLSTFLEDIKGSVIDELA